MSGYEEIRKAYLTECFIRKLEGICGIKQPEENRREIAKYAESILERPDGKDLLTGDAYEGGCNNVLFEGLLRCRLPETYKIRIGRNN